MDKGFIIFKPYSINEKRGIHKWMFILLNACFTCQNVSLNLHERPTLYIYPRLIPQELQDYDYKYR